MVIASHRRTWVSRWRANRPPSTAPTTKQMNATSAAVTSTPECGTNQKPRKITLPVMFATNTCPSSSTLTASTNPVANVNSSRHPTVIRCETGDSTAMLGGRPTAAGG